MNILRKGPFIPCDIGNISDLDADLPQWFDEKQFKRCAFHYQFKEFYKIIQVHSASNTSVLRHHKHLANK